MKQIRYKISEKEDFGCGVPYGAIITNAYLIEEDDGKGLIYFPTKCEWRYKKESGVERGGCGSISFGYYDKSERVWRRHFDDYINLKTNNIFERAIKQCN